jgi:hypothetical protein
VQLTPEFVELAKQLKHVAGERRALEDLEKQIKTKLRKALVAGEIGTDAAGTPLVRAKATRRFNATQANEVLPSIVGADVLASLRTEILDPERCKQILAPALYELCCRDRSALDARHFRPARSCRVGTRRGGGEC